MRADLHLHSVCSDGLLPPRELALAVKRAGVACFALTDHDNMYGLREAEEAARELGLRFVRGWEISAYEGFNKVHILGYGCREDGAYRRFMAERKEGAKVRAAKTVALANAHFGLNVTMEEVEAYHTEQSAPLHTMHIVRAFAERLSAEPGALYTEAFAFGRPAFCAECRPTPEEALSVIHEGGGVAVLAHPGRILLFNEEESKRYLHCEGERKSLLALSEKRREALIRRLTEEGLDGIECVYTTHTSIETEHFFRLAEAYGLLATGGSDFHAEGGANRIGMPPFDADGRLLEALCPQGSE